MSETVAHPQVVLAHDSFTQLGGAERVFLEMAEIFPDAPIYTVVADRGIVKQLPEHVQKRLQTTPVQWFYNIYKNFQHLLPFIPLAIWLTKLPECQVLLSSSSAFAKGFRKPRKSIPSLRGASSRVTKQSEFGGSGSGLPRLDQSVEARNGESVIHINYCHTPTRFLWSDGEYIEQEVPWLVRLPARVFLWWMKRWDLAAAGKVDVFLANSKEVQQRIKKYYGRDSEVVYPFVDMEVWKPSAKASHQFRHSEAEGFGEAEESELSKAKIFHPSQNFGIQNDREGGGYFLIAGRLHAHKDNDLVIRVCNELKLNLHVVGTGRDEAHLKSIAGPTVTFLGRLNDEGLRQEFANARGYIYPQLEDFGLMPLEAASCGTASIGINKGGSRETIVPGVTGEWFSRGNFEELKAILRTWDQSKYSVEELRRHASKFSKQQFSERIQAVVSKVAES